MTFQHTLYQIFYGDNKFDKMNISDTQKYMLTKENALRWMNTIMPPVSTNENNVDVIVASTPSVVAATIVSESQSDICAMQTGASASPNKPKHEIFYPTRKNSVFWCVYLGEYGMSQYMLDEHKYANVEVNERQKMLDYFRDSSNAMKLKEGNNKVSNALIQEINADIAVSNHRDPRSLFHLMIAMSVFYKKTIYLVRKNKYLVFSFYKYENEMEDLNLENTLLIHMKNDREYGISQDITMDVLHNIIQNKYRLESYDKPLKGISSYKVCNLEDISRRLDVEICDEQGIALKKPELYNKLLSHALW